MNNTSFKLMICLLFIVLGLSGAYALHYFLPQKGVFTIVGTNAKLQPGQKVLSDAFYIYAKKGKTTVTFRNVNTGFGFPPYFKFNSAELQADAQVLQNEQVLIEYYGWRNKILDIFPNITSIRIYKEGMYKTSWIRGIVFSLWGLLLVFLFPRFYSLMERKKQ